MAAVMIAAWVYLTFFRESAYSAHWYLMAARCVSGMLGRLTSDKPCITEPKLGRQSAFACWEDLTVIEHLLDEFWQMLALKRVERV